MERVAALAPDLTVGVGSGITHAEYEVLGRIAPVLMQPATYDVFSTLRDVLTGLPGRATGREAEAATLIAATAARFPPAMREAVAAMQAKVAGMGAQTERQDYLIAELRHALYGKRSEPLPPDERQLAFGIWKRSSRKPRLPDALAERNADGKNRRLGAHLRSFLDQCDIKVAHLLAVYRDANRSARTEAAPKSFDKPFKFPAFKAAPVDMSRRESAEAEAAKVTASVEAAVRDIFDQFEAARLAFDVTRVVQGDAPDTRKAI